MKRYLVVIIFIGIQLLPFCKKGGVEQLDLPQILSFNANPSTIYFGDSSVISWNVSNATSVMISPLIGNVAPTGSIEITDFSTDTIFTLSASNIDGTINRSITITVKPAPLLLQSKIGVKGWKNGFPTFFGWVVNNGNATAYNVFVEGWALDANESILDYSITMSNPTNIPAGIIAEFQLQFPYLNGWKKVASVLIHFQYNYNSTNINQKFKIDFKTGKIDKFNTSFGNENFKSHTLN